MRLSDRVFANLRDAVHLNPLFPLRHVWPHFGRAEMHLNVRGCGAIGIRIGHSDAITVRSVFRDLCYDVRCFPQAGSIMAFYNATVAAGQIPLIIDAGANIGAATIWFATNFPAARIIAIEPEPRNAEICRRNVARLPNVQVVEAALGATSGRTAIANSGEAAWAFITTRSDDGKIPVVTIPELVAAVPKGRLFAAKIDIEGFESDVFSENTGWLEELKFFFLEPHDWSLPDKRTSRAFQKRMADADFDILVAGENLLYVAPDQVDPRIGAKKQ